MQQSSEPDVRSQAELLHDLWNGPVEDQARILKRLAVVGEAEALDAVIDHLYEQPAEQRAEGIETLRVLATKYVPADRYKLADILIPALGDAEWSHRLIAARLFNAHPNEMATYALRDLIDEAREKVFAEQKRRFSPARVVAERTLGESILALANCGGLSVLPDILAMLDDPPLRAVATRALGVIGSETERMRLEDLVEDDDVHVRDAAQWSLGFMDQRMEQFMTPPDQQPPPPPDRLHPLYWAHRQLFASDDHLLQFLIVRVAIEHLMLDAFLSDGRVPETCKITVRRYEGDTPPEFRQNRAEVVGVWQYWFEGPNLIEIERSDLPASLPEPQRLPRPGSGGREARMTISYPASIYEQGEGQVSFDCQFGPFMGRGWIYKVEWQEETWSFALQRRTWAS